MTAETNDERLESYKWLSATRPLSREEVFWLIQPAERAQEMEDYYSKSANFINQVELEKENDCLREAIHEIKDKTNSSCLSCEGVWNFANDALKGRSQ